MEQNNIHTFNSPTIKCFRPSEDIRALGRAFTAYHYTSPEACLQVLQNRSLHFTDIRYMNDKAETIYIFKVLLDFLEEHKGKFPFCEQFINELLKENKVDDIRDLSTTHIIYNELEGYRSSRKFIFCLSRDSDSLSMWNYYVRNGKYQGYNIGFNIPKLLKTFDTPQQNQIDAFVVYYGDILYSQKEQFDELFHFFVETENNVKKRSKGENASVTESIAKYLFRSRTGHI